MDNYLCTDIQVEPHGSSCSFQDILRRWLVHEYITESGQKGPRRTTVELLLLAFQSLSVVRSETIIIIIIKNKS